MRLLDFLGDELFDSQIRVIFKLLYLFLYKQKKLA